jgi:ATP-dependent DNA helicase RecG
MPIAVLSSKNSLNIPVELLKEAGLQPGDNVSLEVVDGRIVLSAIVSPGASSEISDGIESAGHAAALQPLKSKQSLQEAIALKNLQTQMQFIKGVGPKLSELLQKKGVKTVEDALYLMPNRYEDRRELREISALRPGYTEVFSGRVVSADTVTSKGGRRFFEVVLSDGSGTVNLKWFNSNPTFMKRVWKIGRVGILTGDVSQYNYQREVHHPDVEWVPEGGTVQSVMESDPINFGRIVPVYPLTEGLGQKVMRKVMKEVTEGFLQYLQQVLPLSILDSMRLPGLKAAIANLHQPHGESNIDEFNQGNTVFHKAVAFDEFFFWELGLALKRRGITMEDGIAYKVNHIYTKQLAKLLPFELTAAQRRVLSEIKSDMMAPHPMHRLVQGDVGCGKTLVALMAALVAVENGYQVAIMAPTELLAEQHWLTIHRWCSGFGIKAVLITSALKGKEKTLLLSEVADGTAQIVIGTHAVIQEKVEFERLGLGIIDEQHRFGVLQRGILKKKGLNPDILVMTATPIPRTLAMTLFGDLSLSVIDELPPGRTPVETKVYFETRRSQVYQAIRDEIKHGYQAYIIYPLVEETEKSDMKAAAQMAEHLEKSIFPDLRIGLLHGRMKPEEKESVMASFKSKELDLLVSTTVIEVGIDVPNATLMVIEHAERFGLSQLHQLRGRVGRGAAKSRCILMTPGRLTEDGERRLRVMEATTDGFRIAEADLEIRGPGDFLGTRQSGLPDFRVANILRDGTILEQARQHAFRMLEEDPDLERAENSGLRLELLRRWGQRLELGSIG